MTKNELIDLVAKLVDTYENSSGEVVGVFIDFPTTEVVTASDIWEWNGKQFEKKPKTIHLQFIQS